ncbi:MAG: PH domain-containing protein, partial [Gemmatimonadaceae bacterium]|nr:PH domain-containing protein [Gemmatimonadaceae bacterium]
MALTVAASAAQYLEGISEALPDGERVRWRGRPRAGLIARHVLRVRAVALYLGLMLGLSALTAWGQLAGPDLARVLVLPVLLVTIALGVTLLFAWLHARYSTYVITDRRVVMQVGIAIDMSINIPLRVVESADVVRYGDGSAAIALTLLPDFKIAWLALWPHAKTLEFQRPRPMLIGLAA